MEQFIDFKKLPKGEFIWRGAVVFPDYDNRGSINLKPGIFLLAGFHVASKTYHICGEQLFTQLRPSDKEQDVVDFLKESKVDSYYCAQNLDIIKRYRKELNFSSGLADIETSIIRFNGCDVSQMFYVVWDKVRSKTLKYKKDSEVHKAIKRLSISKNDQNPVLECLVVVLSGLDRCLYNDERFDGGF